MPALTKAMGINRPSLYAAFGNKEQLFRKALDRYTTGPAANINCALNEPTARAAVEKLLYGSADSLGDPSHPRGCLAVQGALACSKSAESAQQHAAEARGKLEIALRLRFERAQIDGDLKPDADPAALAKYIAVVSHGMAVHATSGATREQLRPVAETALKAWPS